MPLPGIDTDAMVVREDARALPFAVDVAAGTAVLASAAEAVAIRLLTWGEKCALARFAGQGGAFLERQVLLACAPAADASSRDAALALAMWLHAPDGDALPFDPRLLARVTVELCARLGSGPDAIATLPAPAAEALWRAGAAAAAPAGERSRTPDGTGSGTTRIVVEPDPGEMVPQAGGQGDEAAKTAARGGTGAGWPRIVPVRGATAPDHASTIENIAPSGTADEPADGGAELHAADVSSAKTPGALARAQAPFPSFRPGERLRFRLPPRLMPTAPLRSDDPEAGAAPMTERMSQADGTAQQRHPPRAAHPLIARLTRASHTATEKSVAQPDAWPAAADPIADPQLARLIALVARSAERLEPEPEPDDELIAERFAAGLAEAAATLGIARGR